MYHASVLSFCYTGFLDFFSSFELSSVFFFLFFKKVEAFSLTQEEILQAILSSYFNTFLWSLKNTIFVFKLRVSFLKFHFLFMGIHAASSFSCSFVKKLLF